MLSDAAQKFGLPGSTGASARGAKTEGDEALVATLLEDWTAAITSLFHQLRAGQCPCVFPTPTLAHTVNHDQHQLSLIRTADRQPHYPPLAHTVKETIENI